jgi:lipopolysaccharide/colanic/teichoic acid biosynthesis glycosyltransferase
VILLPATVAVWLQDRHPPFYVASRAGRGGTPFHMVKLRSMKVLADATGVMSTAGDDPRVTAVGRFVRRWKLDELPQLWNVLRGDMNIVGPRPEQPAIFVQLREQLEQYEVRQRVRPGITGWAQINQPYDQCLDDVRRKLALDLEYIGRHSLLEDLRIMALTVPVVVLRKGGW